MRGILQDSRGGMGERPPPPSRVQAPAKALASAHPLTCVRVRTYTYLQTYSYAPRTSRSPMGAPCMGISSCGARAGVKRTIPVRFSSSLSYSPLPVRRRGCCVRACVLRSQGSCSCFGAVSGLFDDTWVWCGVKGKHGNEGNAVNGGVRARGCIHEEEPTSSWTWGVSVAFGV